jgi:hypothetical protein
MVGAAVRAASGWSRRMLTVHASGKDMLGADFRPIVPRVPRIAAEPSA